MHVLITNDCWSLFFSLLDVSLRDVEHLKSIHIYTMQDLLGRFLIHDLSDEFQAFLIQTFQLSEPTASMITQLLERWTKYNLDVSRDSQPIDSIRWWFDFIELLLHCFSSGREKEKDESLFFPWSREKKNERLLNETFIHIHFGKLIERKSNGREDEKRDVFTARDEIILWQELFFGWWRVRSVGIG